MFVTIQKLEWPFTRFTPIAEHRHIFRLRFERVKPRVASDITDAPKKGLRAMNDARSKKSKAFQCLICFSNEAISARNGKPCFESFFMNGIEDLPLFLIHTVSASSIGIKASLLSCKIIRGSWFSFEGLQVLHPNTPWYCWIILNCGWDTILGGSSHLVTGLNTLLGLSHAWIGCCYSVIKWRCPP